MRIALIASLLLLASPASAWEVRELAVEHEDGRYRISTLIRMEAPPAAVYGVLTDFERLERIDRTLVDVSVIGAEDGAALMETIMEGCVAFFCRRVSRVDRFELHPEHRLRAESLEQRSDFFPSIMEWELEPDGDGTLMRYRWEMEPAFFVPPLIGPWMVKRSLRAVAPRFARNIEFHARRDIGLDPSVGPSEGAG